MAKPIKRYLLFSFPQYYPSGGWHDFRGMFDTIEEAIKCRDASPYKVGDDWQLVDITVGTDVPMKVEQPAWWDK